MTASGVEPVAKLVLDTSAFSWFRRRHPRVLDLVAAAQVIAIPVTVLGELEAGFALGSRQQENRGALADFLDEPGVVALSTTPSVARWYGVLMADLRRAGTPVPTHDLWIAATTADAGGHLLTFDRHFAKIEGIGRTILEA